MTSIVLEQEKLSIINKLSNCIQKVNATEAKDIAYFIHQIVEAADISLDMYRKLQGFQILANKDLFINIK